MVRLDHAMMLIWFPLTMFSAYEYFTNYPLVKSAMKPAHTKLLVYLGTYFMTLYSHMTTEFEVQIRDGEVTLDGQQMIRNIHCDYIVFQYKKNITEILVPLVSSLSKQPNQVGTHELIQSIIPTLILAVESRIQFVQQQVLDQQRRNTNKMCMEKCLQGPVVHNLTSIDIPVEILKLIGSGLHVVPNDHHDSLSAKETILSDLRSSAISYYRETMGTYPHGIDQMITLGSALQHLSMLTPCGSPHSEFYFKMRDICDDEIDVFLNTLRFENDMLKPQEIVSKYLPSDVIITTTDKNLGVALVPIQWFRQTYESQCLKGGYIPVDMSEEMCINFLKRKIQDLWDTCSSIQRKLLKSVWPKQYSRNFRIGVMKVTPKIHKLLKITPDSWKQLSSRPIRGAENCPINPPSKVQHQLLYISFILVLSILFAGSMQISSATSVRFASTIPQSHQEHP